MELFIDKACYQKERKFSVYNLCWFQVVVGVEVKLSFRSREFPVHEPPLCPHVFRSWNWPLDPLVLPEPFICEAVDVVGPSLGAGLELLKYLFCLLVRELFLESHLSCHVHDYLQVRPCLTRRSNCLLNQVEPPFPVGHGAALFRPLGSG